MSPYIYRCQIFSWHYSSRVANEQNIFDTLAKSLQFYQILIFIVFLDSAHQDASVDSRFLF